MQKSLYDAYREITSRSDSSANKANKVEHTYVKSPVSAVISPDTRSITPENTPNVVSIPQGKRKRCSKCGNIGPIEDFGNNPTSSDGRQSYCRSCRNELHVARRKKDPAHRIRHHFHTRMTKQMEENMPRNLFENMERYIGYSFRKLVQYLDEDIREREQITLMDAFENGYHIDHIRPLSSFHPKECGDEEFKACWAMTNLKLIPAATNLAKGSKYDLPEATSRYEDGPTEDDLEDMDDMDEIQDMEEN